MNSDLLFFATLILVASISPGPNILIVIINSMKVGWKKAYWTIAGNLLALLLIALTAALGIGAILVNSQFLFSALNLIGGIYLCYLGIKMWLDRNQPLDINTAQSQSRTRWQLFFDGFTVSLRQPQGCDFSRFSLSSIHQHRFTLITPVYGDVHHNYLHSRLDPR